MVGGPDERAADFGSSVAGIVDDHHFRAGPGSLELPRSRDWSLEVEPAIPKMPGTCEILLAFSIRIASFNQTSLRMYAGRKAPSGNRAG